MNTIKSEVFYRLPLVNRGVARPISFGIVGLCLAFVSTLDAQEWAATTPKGIYTVKVAGKPEGKSQARTYLGIQLLPQVSAASQVGEVSGNSFTLTSVPSPATVMDPERGSYIHVITGTGRGFISDITEFRTTDFLCAKDLSSWIEPGVLIYIRPHPNLADLFGVDNRFGLASGPDATHADNVVAWDAEVQKERVYYFHSTRERWEEKGINADASQAVMRFPYGLYIIRRSEGTLRIALSGEIGADSVLLPVRTGDNIFSLPINLSASLVNLISSEGDFPVIKGKNANQADLLTLEEPSTGDQCGPFYYSTRPNSVGWREIGVNGSTESIRSLDFLSTLVLRRRHGASGYVLAEGSLLPGPITPLPPDPEPGEVPLIGELAFTVTELTEDILLTVETSPNLQTWTTYAYPTVGENRVTFQLPAGQTRLFYRLKVTVIN